MMPFPGDILEGDNGMKFEVGRLVAYQGKPDCASWECTRVGTRQRDDGTWGMGECRGYHCSLCDAPTNMYGHHNCPRASEVSDAA